MMNYIAMGKCKHGFLYRINSRNLSLGVYDGNEGFIGIRTKFGDRYLFTEFHHDQGAPFGTVFPLEELEQVPMDLEIKECGETKDRKTGRLVKFDTPISQGGKGWYFVDTGEASTEIYATSLENKDLFDYLDGRLRHYHRQDKEEKAPIPEAQG